jgi:hypothetical protein
MRPQSAFGVTLSVKVLNSETVIGEASRFQKQAFCTMLKKRRSVQNLRR